MINCIILDSGLEDMFNLLTVLIMDKDKGDLDSSLVLLLHQHDQIMLTL